MRDGIVTYTHQEYLDALGPVLERGTAASPTLVLTGRDYLIRGAANHRFQFGIAWRGGRREHGGPVDPEPHAYAFACATVIDGQPHPYEGDLAVGEYVLVADAGGRSYADNPALRGAAFP